MEWHPFPEYEDILEITRDGRVRSFDKRIACPQSGGSRVIPGRERKVCNSKGYKIVHVKVDGKKVGIYLHRPIAILWVPNPEGKPYVNHIDGDRSNNDPSNLEWCTHQENMAHAFRTGLAPLPKTGKGEDSPSAKLSWEKVDEIRDQYKLGVSRASIARCYGVSPGTIGFIVSNQTWVRNG